MVKQQHITDSQKLRLKAVHCKQHNQSWSAAKIGKHIGCSGNFVSRWVNRYQQLGSVNDSHRSGRPQKADAAAQEYIFEAAQLPECTSAADIAAKTQQAVGLKISASAITRLLRRKGLQHLSAKVVPNADSQTEAGQSHLCKSSPQEGEMLMAPSANHRQQVLQIAFQRQTCWQVVHPSHKRSCCQTQA